MEAAVKNDQSRREIIDLHHSQRLPIDAPGAAEHAKGPWWNRIFHWETWDWRTKYIFIAPVWLWFCFRARSFWFFSASNPTLTFGGFDGESKKEMYAQLPPGSFPNSIFVSPHIAFARVADLLHREQLEFPVAVKPDVGKMGLMCRKICSRADLKTYHEKIGCTYIIQKWITYPLEVSVFYYRVPGSEKGNITGFVKKEFLSVTGDGRSTLWELILQYPRVRFRLDEMRGKHRHRLHHVLRKGEAFCLSPALNLSRGGKLVSLDHEKDDRLLQLFDQLSHYTGAFYYGRYDIKCNSVEELRQGTNFSILEFNGSGAEPHHVYGNEFSLWKACSELVAHWTILFKISQANNRRGIPYWKFRAGWRFLRNTGNHLKTLKSLDAATALE